MARWPAKNPSKCCPSTIKRCSRVSGDALTQALREQLQTEGTYHLAGHGPGDIVVTGVITRYEREGLSYLSADVVTPQDYRVEITAHIVGARPHHGHGVA